MSLEEMAIPEIVRFLGLQIDEKVASDLKYSIEMLSSKDPKIFFSGLKILAAIHESNEESAKRVLAEKILSMLCKVMPSYVKRGAEFYELNKTKIEESIKSGKHPLDLKNTLALAKRGSLPAGATEEKPTGFVMTSSSPPTPAARVRPVNRANDDEDDIKVISVEDAMTGEEELVAMAKQDAAQAFTDVDAEAVAEAEEPEPATGEPSAVPALPEESLDLQQPESDPYEDDEWVSARSLKDVVDHQHLFDKEGKVAKDLSSGLNLINPVEREKEIDRNYSSAKGYHDPYTARASASNSPSETFVEPEMDTLPAQDESTFHGVDIADANTMIGQPCGFGDGDISASDGNVYVCSNCKAAFHEGCGKLVLEVEGGRCPACDAAWK
jgi:hypothetical protein